VSEKFQIHGNPTQILTIKTLKNYEYTTVGVIPCQVIQQNGDFSSDPHQNSRNFIRAKISGF